MSSIFSCVFWSFLYLPWKNVNFSNFSIELFTFLLLNCKDSLHILDTSPLSYKYSFFFTEVLHVAFLTFFNKHCLYLSDVPTRHTENQVEGTPVYECLQLAFKSMSCPSPHPDRSHTNKARTDLFQNYSLHRAA